MKHEEWIALIKDEKDRKYARAAVLEALEKEREGYVEEMAKTLEYLNACGGLGMDKHEMIRKALYRFHHHRKILLDNGGSIVPTPTKPTEPLAVLADRKDYALWIEGDGKVFKFILRGRAMGQETRTIHGVYHAAEGSARAYLEALPDVKGGVV